MQPSCFNKSGSVFLAQRSQTPSAKHHALRFEHRELLGCERDQLVRTGEQVLRRAQTPFGNANLNQCMGYCKRMTKLARFRERPFHLGARLVKVAEAA